MNESFHNILGWVLFVAAIGGLMIALKLMAMWEERCEAHRARRQGFRVKLNYGFRNEWLDIWYYSGEIQRKFEAKWGNGKWTVDLSLPYVDLYHTPDEYWKLMRDRVTSELKRLLRDKVEIIA